MTAITRVWLECDRAGCAAQYPERLRATTKTDAREQAAIIGWRHVREDRRMKDICGECIAEEGK